MQPLIISKNPVVPSVDEIERCTVNSGWTKAALLTKKAPNQNKKQELYLAQFGAPASSSNNNSNNQQQQNPSTAVAQNILLSENGNPPVSSTVCLIGSNDNNNNNPTNSDTTVVNDLAWCSKESVLYAIGNNGQDLICFNFEDNNNMNNNNNSEQQNINKNRKTTLQVEDFDLYKNKNNNNSDEEISSSSVVVATWAVSVPHESVEAACFSQNRDEPTKIEKEGTSSSAVSELRNLSFTNSNTINNETENKRKILGIRTDSTRLGVWVHLQSMLVSFQFLVLNQNSLHCVSARRVPLPSNTLNASSCGSQIVWCVGPSSVVTLSLPNYYAEDVHLSSSANNRDDNNNSSSENNNNQQLQILNAEMMVWDISGTASVCIAHIPLMLENYFIPKMIFASTNNNTSSKTIVTRNITLHFGGDGVDTLIIFDGDRGTASWFDLTLEERKQQQRSKTSAASTRAARFDQSSLAAHDPVALLLQPVSEGNKFYSWNSFRSRFDPSLRQMFSHSLNLVYQPEEQQQQEMLMARKQMRANNNRRRSSAVMTNADLLMNSSEIIENSSSCKLLELHTFDGPNGEIWVCALLMFLKNNNTSSSTNTLFSTATIKAVVISAKDNKKIDEIAFQAPCVPIEHVGGGGSGGSNNSAFIYSTTASSSSSSTQQASSSIANNKSDENTTSASANEGSVNNNNSNSIISSQQLQQQLLQLNSLHLCAPILFEEGVSALALIEGGLRANNNNGNNRGDQSSHNNRLSLSASGQDLVSSTSNNNMDNMMNNENDDDNNNSSSSSSNNSKEINTLNSLIQKFAHRAASATRILCRLNDWDDASVREATIINAANLSQQGSGGSSSSNNSKSSMMGSSKNNEMALANELSNLLNFTLEFNNNNSSNNNSAAQRDQQQQQDRHGEEEEEDDEFSLIDENILLLIEASDYSISSSNANTNTTPSAMTMMMPTSIQNLSLSPDLTAALSACSTLHKIFSAKYRELNLEDLMARERFETLVSTGINYAEKLSEKIMTAVNQSVSNSLVLAKNNDTNKKSSNKRNRNTNSSSSLLSSLLIKNKTTTKIDLTISSDPRKVDECVKQYNHFHQLQQHLANTNITTSQQQQQAATHHQKFFNLSPLSLTVSLLESWCRLIDCIRFCVGNSIKQQPSFSEAITSSRKFSSATMSVSSEKDETQAASHNNQNNNKKTPPQQQSTRKIFIKLVKKILSLVESGRMSAANQQLIQLSGQQKSNNNNNNAIPEVTAIVLSPSSSVASASTMTTTKQASSSSVTSSSFNQVKHFVEAISCLVLSSLVPSSSSSKTTTSSDSSSLTKFTLEDVQKLFMCIAKLFPIKLKREIWFKQMMLSSDSFVVRNRIRMMTMLSSIAGGDKNMQQKLHQTLLDDCFNLLGNESDASLLKLINFSLLRSEFVESASRLFPLDHQRMPIVFRIVDHHQNQNRHSSSSSSSKENHHSEGEHQQHSHQQQNLQIVAVTGLPSSFPLRIFRSKSEETATKTIQHYHVARIEQLVYQHYNSQSSVARRSTKSSSSSSKKNNAVANVINNKTASPCSSLFDTLLRFFSFSSNDSSSSATSRSSDELILFSRSILSYAQSHVDFSVAFIGGKIIREKLSSQSSNSSEEFISSLKEIFADNNNSSSSSTTTNLLIRSIFATGTGDFDIAEALNLPKTVSLLLLPTRAEDSSSSSSSSSKKKTTTIDCLFNLLLEDENSTSLRASLLSLADYELAMIMDTSAEKDVNTTFWHNILKKSQEENQSIKTTTTSSSLLQSWLHDNATIRTLQPKNQEEFLQVSDSALRLLDGSSESAASSSSSTFKKLFNEVNLFFSMKPRGQQLRDHSDTLAECCTYTNKNEKDELVVFHAVKAKKKNKSSSEESNNAATISEEQQKKQQQLIMNEIVDGFVLGRFESLKNVSLTESCVRILMSKNTSCNEEDNKEMVENTQQQIDLKQSFAAAAASSLPPHLQQRDPRWMKLLKQIRIFGANKELNTTSDSIGKANVEQILLACQEIFIAKAQQQQQQQDDQGSSSSSSILSFFAENNTLLFLSLLGFTEEAQNILRSFEMSRSEEEEGNSSSSSSSIVDRESAVSPWLCLICSSSSEHDADLESEKKAKFKKDAKDQKWARLLQHAFAAKIVSEDEKQESKMKTFLFELMNSTNAPNIQSAVFPQMAMEIAISSSRKLFSTLAASSLAITIKNSSPMKKKKKSSNNNNEAEKLSSSTGKRRGSSSTSLTSNVNSSSSWGRRICANVNTRAFLRDTGIDSLNNSGRGMVVARAVLLALNASRNEAGISTQLESFFMSATSAFSELSELNFPVALSVLQKLFSLSSPFPFFVAYRVVTELGENLQLLPTDLNEFGLLRDFCRALQLLADERYNDASEFIEREISSHQNVLNDFLSRFPAFVDWVRLAVVKLCGGNRFSGSSNNNNNTNEQQQQSSSSTAQNTSAFSVVQSLACLLKAVPLLGDRFYFSPHGASDAVIALESAMKTCLYELTRNISISNTTASTSNNNNTASSSSQQQSSAQQQQPSSPTLAVFTQLLAIACDFSRQATETHLASDFTTKVWAACRSVDDLQLAPVPTTTSSTTSQPSSPITASPASSGMFKQASSSANFSPSSSQQSRKFRSPREVWNYFSQDFTASAFSPGSSWSTKEERASFIEQVFSEWMMNNNNNNENHHQDGDDILPSILGSVDAEDQIVDTNNDNATANTNNNDETNNLALTPEEQDEENESALILDDFFGQLASSSVSAVVSAIQPKITSTSVNVSKISPVTSSAGISVSGLLIWLVAFTVPVKDLSLDILIEITSIRLEALTEERHAKSSAKQQQQKSTSSSATTTLSEQRLKHLISILSSFRDHQYKGAVSQRTGNNNNNEDSNNHDDDQNNNNNSNDSSNPATLPHLLKYVLNACLVHQEVPEVELEGHILHIHDACPNFDEIMLEKPILDANAIRMLDPSLLGNFFFKQWLGRTFAVVPKELLSTFGQQQQSSLLGNKKKLLQNQSTSSSSSKEAQKKKQQQLRREKLTYILKPFVGQDQAEDISQFMNPNTVSSTLRDIIGMPCSAWRPSLSAENPKNYINNPHEAELVLSSSDSPLLQLTNFEVATLEKKIEAVQLLLSRLEKSLLLSASTSSKAAISATANKDSSTIATNSNPTPANSKMITMMTEKQRDGIINHVVYGIFACWIIPLLGYRNPEDAKRMSTWANRQLSVLSESYQPALKAFCCCSESFPIKPTSKLANILNMDQIGDELRIKAATMLWSNEVENLVRLLFVLGGEVNEETVLAAPTTAAVTSSSSTNQEKSSSAANNNKTAPPENPNRALFTTIEDHSASSSAKMNSENSNNRELQEETMILNKMKKKLRVFSKFLPSSQVLLQKLFDLVAKLEDATVDTIVNDACFSEARLFLTTVGWKLISEGISTASSSSSSSTTSSGNVINNTTNSSTTNNNENNNNPSSNPLHFFTTASSSSPGSPSKAQQTSSSATAVGRGPQNNKILVTEGYLKVALGFDDEKNNNNNHNKPAHLQEENLALLDEDDDDENETEADSTNNKQLIMGISTRDHHHQFNRKRRSTRNTTHGASSNNSNSNKSLTKAASSLWDPILISRFLDEAQNSIYSLLHREDLCPIGRFLYCVDDPVWFLTPLLNHLLHVGDYNPAFVVPLANIVQTEGANYPPLTDSPTRLALMHYFLAAADFSVNVCDSLTEMYSYFGHNSPLANGLEHQAWQMLQSFVKTQDELVNKSGGGQGHGSGKNDQNAASARRLEKLLDEVLVSFEQAAEAFFHSELYDKCYLCVQTIRILDAQRRELLLQAQSPATSTGGALVVKSGGLFSSKSKEPSSSSANFNSVANVAYSGIPQELLKQITNEQEKAKRELAANKSGKRPSRPSILQKAGVGSTDAATSSSVAGHHPTTPEFNNSPEYNPTPSNSKNAAAATTTNVVDAEIARRQSAVALASYISDPLSLLLVGSGCDFNNEDWVRVIHAFVVAQSQINTKSSSADSATNLALKNCTNIINFYKDSCVTVAAELPSRMRNILLNAANSSSSHSSGVLLVVAAGTQKVVWEEMIRILEKS